MEASAAASRSKNHYWIVPMHFSRAATGLTLLPILALFAGCPEPPASRAPASSTAVTTPGDPVLRERAEKDADFRSEDSPLIPELRPGFRGLSYYPIDPALRFTVPLKRYAAPAPVRLGTNTGEIRSGVRYGYFEFRAGGRECRLQVYRLEDSPGAGGSHLFIPFRDATSGQETYEAGRYLELTENTSGMYDLDFNRAHNPFCAYNSEYSCPVPPAENTLAVPIRAGEKKFDHAEARGRGAGS